MPNWCRNTLKLSETAQDIREVLKDYLAEEGEGTFLDFNKIIPMPPELEGTTSPSDGPNWYDWRVANWGTKWNSSEAQIDEDCISFGTAWSPPLPVIAHLSELTGKAFVIYYIEEGMDYCGKTTFTPEGEHEIEEYDSIEDASQELKDFFGYEEEDDCDEEEED